MADRTTFHSRRTVLCYLGSCLLDAPLFSLYALLQFVFFKDLRATTLQVAVLISLKPVVAVFSSYLSALIANRPHRLRNYLVLINLLAVLPVFCFPFVENIWFYSAGFGVYFLVERATIPAWMEVLRRNLTPQRHNRTVSKATMISFVAACLFPTLIAPSMDLNPAIWRWLFFALGCVSLTRVALQMTLPVNIADQSPAPLGVCPWRQSWQVLRRRPDFAFFQLIFFFGGLGLMMSQVAFSKFVNVVLQLSYTEIAVAFSLCKGVGFLLGSPIWSRWFHRFSLYQLCALVALLAGVSIALVPCSQIAMVALYAGSLLYGIMQAGSQLSWQLSGPLFARNEDSAPYTTINVLLVGIRGCIGPYIGGFLGATFGLTVPFIVGSALCWVGASCGLVGHRMFGLPKTKSAQSSLVES